MKSALRYPILAAAVLICRFTAPAAAQYPTSLSTSVPRTPDGKPDLNAPAPRTPDGKPDLSGIWKSEIRNGVQFVDFGWNVDGGLPYQQWAADTVKARMAENGKDDPYTRCL